MTDQLTDQDLQFARLALDAAAEGVGLASPNPLVGTLIVRDGVVVGRGTHRYDDLKHAEVVALEEAGDRAQGATVYVNLEPCSHVGRTPPCVGVLVDAGIARVVASIEDPAPYVNGRGFEQLRAAGIDVVVGAERDAAELLNERYLHFMRSGRPFVTVKFAATLDGRVATSSGRSKWITGDAAREASQQLRRANDAILVGVGTIVADDPSLTYRGLGPKRRPLTRAVIDPHLRIPVESQVVTSANEIPTIVYTAEKPDADRSSSAEILHARGIDVVELQCDPQHGMDLKALVADLAARRLHGLIVEGGPETTAGFVAGGLVDKVVAHIAPKLLGGRNSLGAVGGEDRVALEEALVLERIETRRIGNDIEVTGYPVRR